MPKLSLPKSDTQANWIPKRHPAGAKTRVVLLAFAARLKP
jgi:hypothetical protein